MPHTAMRPKAFMRSSTASSDDAADVLEVAVDAVRAGCLQRRAERLQVAVLPVVDAGVEAELVDHVAALLRPAGDADRAAAARLGELADDAADGAAGRADDDRLARLGRDDLASGRTRPSRPACRPRRGRPRAGCASCRPCAAAPAGCRRPPSTPASRPCRRPCRRPRSRHACDCRHHAGRAAAHHLRRAAAAAA